MHSTHTLDGYQTLAARTNDHKDQTPKENMAMLSLGVAGEAGEVADYMKKVLFHLIPLDREKLIKELGDVMWYVACLASKEGIPLSEVAYKNIEKLKARYPNGFTTEDSIKRADGELNDQDHD
jgi:NTP pyrophosphatase (non-canonical NTP hydrolase)